MTAALIAAVAVIALVAGFLAGMRSRQIDQNSYWQGFADGEDFGRINERLPSSN